MSNENFCIIVLSYNHPQLTVKAISSALKFSNTILIVHNGSELQNVELLKQQFSELNHLVLQKNLGYSGGVNAGFRWALDYNYEWLLLLTNDCELQSLPKKLNRNDSLTLLRGGQSKLLLSDVSIVTPQILKRSGKVDSVGGLFAPAKAALRHCRVINDFIDKRGFAYPYAPGSCFLVHKSILDKVGMLDESLGTYWEDVDFSVRAIKAGFLINVDLTWQVTHGIGKTCRSHEQYSIYYYHRNRKRISWRYASVLQKPRLVLILLASWFWVFKGLVLKKRFKGIGYLWSAILD